MTLEDLDGTCECLVFSDLYIQVQDMLEMNMPFFISALVDAAKEEDKPKLIAKQVIPLNMAPQMYTEELHVRLHEGNARPEELRQIREIFKENSGSTTAIFALKMTSGELAFVEAGNDYKVTVSQVLIDRLNETIGEGCLHFKPDLSVPEAQKRPWERKTRDA